MREVVEEIRNGKKRAEIMYDELADDPRTSYDHIGKMVCSHSRYRLGDDKIAMGDFGSWDEVEESLVADNDAVVVLPLYLYDHSGITMNTTGFSCGWDSGKVGFIYVTREDCVKEFGEIFDIQMIKEILKSEVEEYDFYLSGQVYWFKIYEIQNKIVTCPHCNGVVSETEEEVEIDSSSGFYGLKYIREVVEGELGLC